MFIVCLPTGLHVNRDALLQTIVKAQHLALRMHWVSIQIVGRNKYIKVPLS